MDIIESQRKQTISTMLFLCFAVAIYSLSGIFTKMASGYSFLSFPYFAFLIGAIVVLGLYAVLWQMALKRVPLNQAYPYRSLSIVYGLSIAYFIFHEEISWQNLSGCVIVILGLLVLTTNK